MATAHQIKTLATRVEKLATRLGQGKRIEYKVYLSFSGKVEADENGDPVRPINWVRRYRDGVPVGGAERLRHSGVGDCDIANQVH